VTQRLEPESKFPWHAVKSHQLSASVLSH